MAALAADGPPIGYRGNLEHGLASGDAVASDVIYANSLVSFNGTAGIAPVTGDLPFAGIATKQVDNSSGAAGDKTVEYISSGVVRITQTITQAIVVGDIGRAVYCATDNPADIDFTSAAQTLIGKIVQVHSADDIEIMLANDAGATS